MFTTIGGICAKQHRIVWIMEPVFRGRMSHSSITPGVNRLGTYGRWAFAEFTDIYEIQADFKSEVENRFKTMIAEVLAKKSGAKR